MCQQNNIQEYPTIAAFKSAEPMKLIDPSADDIAKAVGVMLTTLDRDISRTERIDDTFSRPVDILGASVDGKVQTKEAAYSQSHMHYKPKYSQMIALNI